METRPWVGWGYPFLDNTKKHWKGVILEKNDHKGTFHALRWEVYMK